MKRKLSCFIFFMFISLLRISATSKNLVIKITKDTTNYSGFDKNTKSIIDSAYNQFEHDLTLVSGISLRTSNNDSKMREIQKQSQVEAATGLGSERSVYSAELGSRSDLAVSFAINPAGSNTYQLVCKISEIESMKLITTENTKRLSLEKITESVVDEIAYRILLDLEERGYLAYFPSDVKHKLHHIELSESDFEKTDTNTSSKTTDTSDFFQIGKNAFENLNYKLAFEYLSKAKNTPETLFYLGYMYYMGYGTEQNLDKAVLLYEMSAEQGYAEAQLKLGLCYYYGDGVSQSYEKAFSLWQKSAAQGNLFSQNNLGYCYYYGYGTSVNYEEAFYWWKKASEKENYYAFYNLGDYYSEGKAIPKDSSKAFFYYKKAAEEGNIAGAQASLGECYYYGDGTEKDYETAVFWFKKAAEQGDYEAQYSLGYCYYWGEGVTKDLKKAKEWYQLSAEQDYEPAKNALRTQRFTEYAPSTYTSTNSYQNKSSTYNSYKRNSYYNTQEARKGFFLDTSYIRGAFYHGFDVRGSLAWGGEHISAGFDLDLIFPKLTNKYTASAKGKWIMYSTNFLLQGSITLGNFKPYIGAGIGIFCNLYSVDYDSTNNISNYDDASGPGLHLEGILGADYNFNNFAVGLQYKLRYFRNYGYADNYGISIGFTW